MLSLRGSSDCNLLGSQVAVHAASNLARYQLGGQALLAKAGASSSKGLLCCAQLLMLWPGHITAVLHSLFWTRSKRPIYVMAYDVKRQIPRAIVVQHISCRHRSQAVMLAWPSTHKCRKAWRCRSQRIDLGLTQNTQNINVILEATQAHISHCQCHVHF